MSVNKIRKIDSITGFISTVASGLHLPRQIAMDSNGDLIIADYLSYTIKKLFLSNGTTSVLAGTGTSGFNGDGLIGTSTKISVPTALALTSKDEIVFADYSNKKIRKILTNGTVVGVFIRTMQPIINKMVQRILL